MPPAPKGLLDTSVLIALESGRAMHMDLLPDEVVISPITIGELRAGVLVAVDVETRARQLATVEAAAAIELLPVDADVAAQWARLRVQLVEAGRRIDVNHLWIAATAAAHRLPIVTQDADFEPLQGTAGIEIIRL